MAPSAIETTVPVQKTTNLPNPINADFLDRLDSDFIDYYNRNLAIKPPTHAIDLAQIRAFPKRYDSPWYNDFSYEPFVKDMKILADDGHQFTVRCYHPDPRTSPFGQGPYPIYVNFHGTSNHTPKK